MGNLSSFLNFPPFLKGLTAYNLFANNFEKNGGKFEKSGYHEIHVNFIFL